MKLIKTAFIVFAIVAVTLGVFSFFIQPTYAAEALTININGSNNTVTIFGDGTTSQQQNSNSNSTVPALSSIPSNARKVNIWSNGVMATNGFIVEGTVYLASYEDVHKVFPSETRNWQNVETPQATPLSMWTDSFGYTFKIEANNVFLFKEGLADNSGELVTAKPAVVYVDENRINVTVYLSDEDATVYAGLVELQKIFSANADKIVCNDTSQYTVNYWAEQFGYKLVIEDNVVMLTKDQTTTTAPEPTQAPSQTTTPTTTPSQTVTPTPVPTSKTYKIVVENTSTNYTAKVKNGKVYVSKACANKLLKQYGKATVSKSITVKALAKKCGVSCKINGSYIYLNKKSNPAIVIRYNNKIWDCGGRVQKKGGVYFTSASTISSLLGTSVNWNPSNNSVVVVKDSQSLQFTVGSKSYFANDGKQLSLKAAPYVLKQNNGGAFQFMLPIVKVAKYFGYSVNVKKESGVFVISIVSK